MAPTVKAAGALAGDLVEASLPSFPAPTTTKIPSPLVASTASFNAAEFASAVHKEIVQYLNKHFQEIP
jgi:hypothetical protein